MSDSKELREQFRKIYADKYDEAHTKDLSQEYSNLLIHLTRYVQCSSNFNSEGIYKKAVPVVVEGVLKLKIIFHDQALEHIISLISNHRNIKKSLRVKYKLKETMTPKEKEEFVKSLIHTFTEDLGLHQLISTVKKHPDSLRVTDQTVRSRFLEEINQKRKVRNSLFHFGRRREVDGGFDVDNEYNFVLSLGYEIFGLDTTKLNKVRTVLSTLDIKKLTREQEDEIKDKISDSLLKGLGSTLKFEEALQKHGQDLQVVLTPVSDQILASIPNSSPELSHFFKWLPWLITSLSLTLVTSGFWFTNTQEVPTEKYVQVKKTETLSCSGFNKKITKLDKEIAAVKSIDQIENSLVSLKSQHRLLVDMLESTLKNKCEYNKLYPELVKQSEVIRQFKNCLKDQTKTHELIIVSEAKEQGWWKYIKSVTDFWWSKEKSFSSKVICTFALNSQISELTMQKTQIEFGMTANESLNMSYACEEQEYKVVLEKSGQGIDVLNLLIKEINEDDKFPTSLVITNPEVFDFNSCKSFSKSE